MSIYKCDGQGFPNIWPYMTSVTIKMTLLLLLIAYRKACPLHPCIIMKPYHSRQAANKPLSHFRSTPLNVFNCWSTNVNRIQFQEKYENKDWWQILITPYGLHSSHYFSMVTFNYCTPMHSTQHLECHVLLCSCPSSCSTMDKSVIAILNSKATKRNI